MCLDMSLVDGFACHSRLRYWHLQATCERVVRRPSRAGGPPSAVLRMGIIMGFMGMIVCVGRSLSFWPCADFVLCVSTK